MVITTLALLPALVGNDLAGEFAQFITLEQVLDIDHELDLLTRALLGEVVRHMLLEVIGDADRHDSLISEVL